MHLGESAWSACLGTLRGGLCTVYQAGTGTDRQTGQVQSCAGSTPGEDSEYFLCVQLLRRPREGSGSAAISTFRISMACHGTTCDSLCFD